MEDEEKLISKEEKENWSQSQLGLRQFSIATAVIIIRKFFKNVFYIFISSIYFFDRLKN